MINKHKILTALLIIAIIALTGCSSLAKPSAGIAIPFAAVADTVAVPFQLTGDAGVTLIEMGDRHQQQVYEVNKDSLTLPLDQLTTLIFFIPGYILLPFDSITPDEYYPLTKSCLNVINAKPKTKKQKRTYETRKLPKDNFEEF